MKRVSFAEMLRSGKNLAIDAGAGTGKTTTLVNTVTSIFLNDLTLNPDEVLLLTFTEKAAAEMRERLFSLWQSLYAKFRLFGTEEIPLMLSDYPGEIDLSPELSDSKEKIVERLKDLNEHCGRLNVSTLHSFCLSLLKEYSIESGCDPDFEVIDSFTIATAFEDAFIEFLEGEFDSENFDARWHDYFALFSDLEMGKKFLWDLFRGICLNSRDLFFIMEDQKSLFQDTDLKPFFEIFLIPYYRKLDQFLRSSSPPEEDIKDAFNSLLPANEKVMSLLTSGKLPGEETLEAHTEIISSISGNRLRNTIHFPLNREDFTNRGFKDGALVYETIRCTLPKLREKIKAGNRILNRLRSGIILGELLIEKTGTMLELFEKHKGGGLDFMDLLIDAAGLIESSKEVRENLKSRYRYLFIDEFQDTDPVQAYLCSFICEKDGAFAHDFKNVELQPGKLFIVGDPRQSIYRFRRADPQMHLSMIEIIRRSGGERKSLAENYRSTSPLVAFFNIFFDTLFDRDSDYSFKYGPPLKSMRSSHRSTPSIWYYSLDSGVEREDFLSSLLRGIKESGMIIEENGAKRPVTWKDIALLYVGDFGKKVLSPLREELNEAGIPLLIPSLKGFYDRQEVKDILFLLESVCDPENKTALYGALKSTIFGFNDTQLASYFITGETISLDLEKSLSMIKRWASLRDTVGVHDLIATILEESGYEYTTLLFPEGERIFFNVEKLLLVSREFDQKYSASLREFTGFLRQQIRVAAEEGEIPYFEEGEDAVRIMTVHSAKGLEFPIVLYYLTGEYSSPDPGPILYDRMRGGFGFTQHNFSTSSCYQMVRDRIDEPGGMREEEIPFIVLEKRKTDAETLRLSYVAMTRAKDSLFIISQPPGPGRMRKNIIAEKLEKFLGKYKTRESDCDFTGCSGKIHYIDCDLEIFSSSVHTYERRAKPAKHKPWKPDMPPLGDGEDATEEPFLVARAEDIATEEEGYRFGEKMHRILEVLPPFEDHLFKERHHLARTIFRNEEERERFLNIVEKLEKSDLTRKYRSFRVHGTEVPLTSFREEMIARDAADVVLTDGKRLLVIDYKTGKRSKEKDTLFGDQLFRYVRAIKSATDRKTTGFVWYIEVDEWFEISP